jgi:hypothetical protein
VLPAPHQRADGPHGPSYRDAAETARATTDVDAKVSAIQGQVDRVVAALVAISSAVEQINETQTVIGGVLTEQAAVTRAILD